MALLSSREALQIILFFLRKDSGGIQLEAIKKEKNKLNLYKNGSHRTIYHIDNIYLILFFKRGGTDFMK